MKRAARFWLWLYGATSVVHLGARWLAYAPAAYFTKPLLLVLLAIYFTRTTQLFPSRFRNYLLAGFGFAWLGDVLLMLSEIAPLYEIFYLLGIVAFLLTHVCYILAFINYRPDHYGLLPARPYAALPVLAYWCLICWIIVPGVPSHLLAPTVIYAAILAGMALMCLHLASKAEFPVWYRMFAGTLLFMISDSLISLNMNGWPIPQATFWVMLTYIAGQYLIAAGGIAANGWEKFRTRRERRHPTSIV